MRTAPFSLPNTALGLPENHETTSCGQGTVVPGPEQEHPILEQHLSGRVLPGSSVLEPSPWQLLGLDLRNGQGGPDFPEVLFKLSESHTHCMDRRYYLDAPDFRPDSSVVSPVRWWVLSRPLHSD